MRHRPSAPHAVLLAAVAIALGACGAHASPSATPSAPPSGAPVAPTSQAPSGTPDRSAAGADVNRLAAVTSADPADAAAYRDLGFAYLQLLRETGDAGLYARAAAAFDRARDLDPADPLVLVGIGSLELARHDFDAALATGRDAERLAPDLPGARAVIVDALVELGRYEDAVAALQELVDLRLDLASLARVSYLRELHGDLPGALEAMREAVRLGSPEPENTAYVTVLAGTLAAWNGSPSEAAAAYDAALALVPAYAPALAASARLAVGRGDLDAAATLLRRAAEAAPLPEYVVALGEVAEAAGDRRAASDPYDLARLQVELLRAAGVTVDVELALFEADHGDPALALDLARAAYDERRTIRTADVLAWALHRAGRSADAAPYVEEALRLGSRDPLLRFHAGAIAAAIGDPSAAREQLQLALDVDPGFSATGVIEARGLLASLED